MRGILTVEAAVGSFLGFSLSPTAMDIDAR
jgi:hypothetical protein